MVVILRNRLGARARRWALVLAWGAGAAGISRAAPLEPKFYVKSWLVDDGLPHNTVNRVAQDQRGFLWIATQGGLARFDGREFRECPLPMAVREATPNIRDLLSDNAGGLLMVPASGGIVQLRDGDFSLHPASAALGGRNLLNLFVEPGGALWLGTGDNTVLRWDAGKVESFGSSNGFDRRSGGRYSFAVDGAGRTWMASGDFLGRYENGRLIRWPEDVGRNLQITSARTGGFWLSTQNRLLKWQRDRLVVVCDESDWTVGPASVQQLFEDRDGILWIGTRVGLFRFNGRNILVVPTSHHQVNALTADAEDNLWVSTSGGGIERLRPRTFELLNAATGMPEDLSTSVCEDANGALWAANRGGGVVRYKEGSMQVFKPAEADAMFEATNVCADHAGNIWVGALDRLYRLPATGGPMMRVEPVLRPVRVLFCAANGDVWVGSGNQGPRYDLGYFRDGVYRAFGPADGFDGQHVISITQQRDGALWLATGTGELDCFRDGRFQTSLTLKQSPAGRIETLQVDSRGGIWMGTVSGLLLKRGEKLFLFTRAHGLADDFITQILEDDRGRLWLSSRRGFFSVSLDELYAVADGRASRVASTTFGRAEGLPGASAPTGGLPMAWRAHDGRLWFATSRGLVGFDPEASLPGQSPPPVYVDAVLIDGRPVAAPALRIPAGTHHTEFRFAALNYTAPEKVRVRYQLVGFDPAWIEGAGQQSAGYGQLPPGSYTLRVTACNQDGRWNETGATLAFSVAPGWWQTWWLRIAGVLAFTGVVGLLVRGWSHRRLKARLERLEREHELEKERTRIARNLHDELGGSLTQIGLLADRIKRQSATADVGDALGRLAVRTRRLSGELESIVWAVSPKNNTWARLATFIAQYARGFFRETPVECQINGVEDVPTLPLAPEAQNHVLAVVKEALNNVLKHSHATHVELRLGTRDAELELRIIDNGIGFDPAAPEHRERNGLANMRARIADLGGRLEIRSGLDGGAEIFISQPLVLRPPVASPRPMR